MSRPGQEPLSVDTGQARSPWTGDDEDDKTVRASPIEDLSLPFSPPPRRSTVEKPPSIPWPTGRGSVTSMSSASIDSDYQLAALLASRSQSRDLIEPSRQASFSDISIDKPQQDVPDVLRAGSQSASPSTNNKRFSWNYNQYEPVSAPAETASPSGFVNRMRSIRSTARRLSLTPKQTIPENDEIDMDLLDNAAKMGSGGNGYSAVDHDQDDDVDLEHGIDLSSFTGPSISHTESISHEYRALETPSRTNTGPSPEDVQGETMTSSQLYESAMQSPITGPARTFKRTSMSISRRTTGLSRNPTIRDLGQNEANKRNEVVRVLMDEDDHDKDGTTHVDISVFAGGSEDVAFNQQSRKPTVVAPQYQVFYPQPNWKPITMRWPYLVWLIGLSVILAVCQEVLYQKSKKEPLYSFKSPQELNTWSFFSFKYLPTMVAVTYGILWQLTDFEVKRLEVYYQLSKSGGALAAESINVDYITFINFLRPFRAIRYKHYAVAICSIATLNAVSLVPVLQTASVILEPDRETRNADPEVLKSIRIDKTWSRFLTTILVLIAAMGCVLLWLLQQRRSGLTADVKGVAGIAAMANRSHILMDFKDMDTAPPDTIHQRLKARRYMLQNSSITPLEGVPVSREDQQKYDQYRRSDNPHPLMLRLSTGVPFIVSMAIFMILIPVVLFTDADVIPDKAPWLLTAVAVAIKLGFSTLENDVRMIEPFYKLWCRHQPPNVLTLDYTGMAFGWLPIRALINKDYLMALVGLGSVLAEILTVCVTSFSGVAGIAFVSSSSAPDNTGAGGGNKNPTRATSEQDAGEETFTSFWTSFALAITIMVYLCMTAALVYARRRHPFLPRQPNTVASVLAYIHQSKMLEDFAGTEKLDNDEMVRRLARIGKKYGLGWFSGRDGETHCGIDQEELTNDYKHGADVRQAVTPWNTNWDTY